MNSGVEGLIHYTGRSRQTSPGHTIWTEIWMKQIKQLKGHFGEKGKKGSLKVKATLAVKL